MSRQVNEPTQPTDGEQVNYETEDLFSDNVNADEGGWILDGADGEAADGVVVDPVQPAVVDPTRPAPAAPAVAQPGAPSATGTAPVQQIDPSMIREVRLPTGHVLRGTADQIIQQQQEIINRRGAAPVPPPQYQQLPAQYQNRGWRDQPGPAPAQPSRTPNRNWSPEQQEAFFVKMAKDPFGALESFMQDYFGNDDPAAAFDHSYSVSVQVSDRIAVADFLANNQDFPASNESGAMVIQRLAADGVELTAGNLEVAFRQLVREGQLVPITVAQPAAQPSNDYRQQYQQPTGVQPPVAPATTPTRRGAAAPVTPSPGGGPASVPRSMMRLDRAEFDSLSTAEQREYIRNHTIPDRFFQQQQR